jgi:hypothetical protein
MEGMWILAAVFAFVTVMGVVAYFISRQSAVQLEAVARELGSKTTSKGGFLGDSVISFEQGGTVFTGRVAWMKYACHYRVTFETFPSLLHFQIKSRRPRGFASYATQPSADRVYWNLSTATSPLSVDYLLSSNDPQKFEPLITDDFLSAEIIKFDLSSDQYFEILFENGSFELFYGSDGRNFKKKLRDMFQTAIKFRDRLSASSPE